MLPTGQRYAPLIVIYLSRCGLKIIQKLSQFFLRVFPNVSKLSQSMPKHCPCSSKVVPSRLNLCYHVATRCVEGVPIQQKVQKWSSLAIFRVFLLAEFLWCSFSLTSSGMKGLQRRYLQLNWSKIFFFVVHNIATQAQCDPWTLIEEQEHLAL